MSNEEVVGSSPTRASNRFHNASNRVQHVRVYCDKSYGYFSPNAHKEKYAGLAQLVRASALQAGGHWFESSTPHHVAVVQLVEHQIVALVVVDSSSTGHPI